MDLDSRFEDRFQRKIEEMKRAQRRPRDVNLLVYQRDDSSIFGQTGEAKLNKKGSRKIRHQVTAERGSLEFMTGTVHGLVDICIQSFEATKVKPSRVAVNVYSRPSDEEPRRAKASVLDGMEQGDLLQHTSRITTELTNMQRKIREISANAESSKDQEVSFHNMSISLNGAVRFWPQVRIVILLIAGYIQVTSVVRYMKSKHIY